MGERWTFRYTNRLSESRIGLPSVDRYLVGGCMGMFNGTAQKGTEAAEPETVQIEPKRAFVDDPR